jgi:hypothetical protein
MDHILDVVAPSHIFEPEHAIGTMNTLPSNERRIHTMEQRQNGNNTRERENSACVCLCVKEKERECEREKETHTHTHVRGLHSCL